MEFRSYRIRIYPSRQQRAQIKRWMKLLRECINRVNLPAYLPKEAIEYQRHRSTQKTGNYVSEIYLECPGMTYPYLKIRGLGEVRCAHRKLPQPLPKHVRIIERKNGDYVALFTPSIGAQHQRVQHNPPSPSPALGIDLGVSTTVTCSNGEKIVLPPHIYRSRIRLQKRLCMAKILRAQGRENSCLARKLKKQIARTKHKLRNQERDFVQKTVAKILQKYDIVVMETLNYDEIIQKSAPSSKRNARLLPKLHKSFLQKALTTKKALLKVSRWFPSSQICSYCGYHFGKHALRDRNWKCPHCQQFIDRDINASRNILQEGLQLLGPI